MNRKAKWLFLASPLLVVLLGLSILSPMPLFSWGWQKKAQDKGRPDGKEAAANAHSPGSQTSRGTDKGKPATVVEVVTVSPGRSAAAMERNITTRLEGWINQIAGVRIIGSRSIAGVSIIDLVFRDDMEPVLALARVNSLIQGEMERLPPNTQPPLVTLRPPPLSPRWEGDDGRTIAGVVTVSSPTLNEADLRSSARIVVRRALLAIPGLAVPVVLGGKDLAAILYLDSAKMEARHVSRLEVAMAVRKAADARIFPGRIAFGDSHFLIQTNNKIGKVGERFLELRDLPILAEPARQVFLRDIATLQAGSDGQTSLLRIDGRRGVGLPVYFAASGSEDAIQDRIKKLLSDMQARPVLREIKLNWVSFHQRRKGGRPEDDGLLTLRLRAPSHLRLGAVEKRVMAIERFLEENIPAKERATIISEVGMRTDVSAAYTSHAGQHDATIRVQLTQERTRSAGAYAWLLRSRLLRNPAFKDLRITFSASDLPKPFALRIRGGRPEQGANLAREVRTRVQAIAGITDVFLIERQDAPCLVLDVDQTKAKQIGLTRGEALSRVLAALPIQNHRPFLSLRASTGSIPLLIQYPEQPDLALDDVLNLAVTGANQQAVKVSNLASIRRTTEAVEIHHVDSSRVLHVRIGIDNRERSDVMADVRKMLRTLIMPNGTRVELVE